MTIKIFHSWNLAFCIPMECRSCNSLLYPVRSRLSAMLTQRQKSKASAISQYFFIFLNNWNKKICSKYLKRGNIFIKTVTLQKTTALEILLICIWAEFMCISSYHDVALVLLHVPLYKESKGKCLLLGRERNPVTKKGLEEVKELCFIFYLCFYWCCLSSGSFNFVLLLKPAFLTQFHHFGRDTPELRCASSVPH